MHSVKVEEQTVSCSPIYSPERAGRSRNLLAAGCGQTGWTLLLRCSLLQLNERSQKLNIECSVLSALFSARSFLSRFFRAANLTHARKSRKITIYSVRDFVRPFCASTLGSSKNAACVDLLYANGATYLPYVNDDNCPEWEELGREKFIVSGDSHRSSKRLSVYSQKRNTRKTMMCSRMPKKKKIKTIICHARRQCLTLWFVIAHERKLFE